MHFTCTHVYDDSFRVCVKFGEDFGDLWIPNVVIYKLVHKHFMFWRKSATKERRLEISADSQKCAVTLGAKFTGSTR